MQNDSNLIIILDTGNPATDGHLQDREFLVSISHTFLPLYELADTLRTKGMRCMTPDAYLNEPAGSPALLISSLTNDRTPLLIAHGATPFILLCQESPFIATRFYFRFKSISKQFVHTVAFEGMRRRAHPATSFTPMRFPIFLDESLTPSTMSFDERKDTVLIAAHKMASRIKEIPLQLMYGRGVRMLYPERRGLVARLAAEGAIDIYGNGWSEDQDPTIRARARGRAPAGGKHEILGTYKFALCYENAAFPGYVTEKIFDAFTAGTVPVYLGDPDITNTIPPTSFIDVRTFADERELTSYLATIDRGEYEAYLAHGRDFLDSLAFQEYAHATFIARIMGMIDAYDS